MSIIIKQGCNKPQIWNITELVNIEQLTKMDNERGKRLDLRWWSNYVEVSVKLVISGLKMNGFSRMICQLVKLPLGEQCLSSSTIKTGMLTVLTNSLHTGQDEAGE